MAQAAANNKPPLFFRLLIKAQNPFMKWLLRSPLHGIVSSKYMLITFTGRKSGTVYTTPVQYVREGDTVYVITSKGYTWWKNLRGGAAVEVVIRGKPYQGDATAVTDEDGVRQVMIQALPTMSATQREQFVPKTVAITITLNLGDMR
ncbi:MAG: nitroreductase family deazaflavin-dependent oxidoreductase [Anaerolineaceae bacterium]|nr:nitroreductase family deazaflavin-dependent oxidoreductase [Anaerolineaceae bacterium]